jgi:hypothetical protein
MSHIPRETSPPPTELSPPNEFATAVTGMQAQIFDAASKYVSDPEAGHASKDWIIQHDEMRVLVHKDGDFWHEPSFDGLKTEGFAVDMKHQTPEGQTVAQAIASYGDNGLELMTDQSRFYPPYRMNPERIKKGREILESFLAGEVTASDIITGRSVTITSPDRSLMSATEYIAEKIGGSVETVLSTVVQGGGDASDTFYFQVAIKDGVVDMIYAPRSAPSSEQAAEYLQEAQRRVTEGLGRVASD